MRMNIVISVGVRRPEPGVKCKEWITSAQCRGDRVSVRGLGEAGLL